MSASIEAMLVTWPQIVPTLTALTTALVRKDTQYFKTSSFAHKLSPTEISPHFKGLFSHTTLVLSITSPFMLLDIDECSDESHDCDINANCTNTNGSHICTCKEGYTGNNKLAKIFFLFSVTIYKSIVFIDIDECNDDSHVCDSNANCTNTNGSHNSICKVGNIINRQSCQWRIQQRYLMSSKAAFHN